MTCLRPADVTVVLVEGDSQLFPGLEIESIDYPHEGPGEDGRLNSAEAEAEAGMLVDALVGAGFAPTVPGTYVVRKFVACYSRDYWGEVDGDYECEGWQNLSSGPAPGGFTDL